MVFSERSDRNAVATSQTQPEPSIRAAAVARTLKARESYSDILDEMKGLRDDGHSLREIAQALNNDGHTERRGRDWNASQVARAHAMAQ